MNDLDATAAQLGATELPAIDPDGTVLIGEMRTALAEQAATAGAELNGWDAGTDGIGPEDPDPIEVGEHLLRQWTEPAVIYDEMGLGEKLAGLDFGLLEPAPAVRAERTWANA